MEIARKIEEAMGNRQGQRTDLPNVLGKSEKGETADIAAAAVGMSMVDAAEIDDAGDDVFGAVYFVVTELLSHAKFVFKFP